MVRYGRLLAGDLNKKSGLGIVKRWVVVSCGDLDSGGGGSVLYTTKV